MLTAELVEIAYAVYYMVCDTTVLPVHNAKCLCHQLTCCARMLQAVFMQCGLGL